MRVQLSILLFVGLFVGLLAVRHPDHCPSVNFDAVQCPEHNSGDYFGNFLEIPGKCGFYQECRDGCPWNVLQCYNCRPFDPVKHMCKTDDVPACDANVCQPLW